MRALSWCSASRDAPQLLQGRREENCHPGCRLCDCPTELQGPRPPLGKSAAVKDHFLCHCYSSCSKNFPTTLLQLFVELIILPFGEHYMY